MPPAGVRSDNGDLVSRAQTGDRGAFSDLVRLHQDEVYTLALRLVADSELAADISQEAFVRAWRALPNFRGDAKFSTWMHRITVNVAWTQRRKQRKHLADPIDESFTEPVSDAISPERPQGRLRLDPHRDRRAYGHNRDGRQGASAPGAQATARSALG